MLLKGGCYCGEVRYMAEGEPTLRAQCHCRECQYITGGAPNLFMIMPEDQFSFTQGESKAFSRADLENPVTREFCPQCGTHLITRAPRRPGAVIVKVGTLDDPQQFSMPEIAIFTCDQQPFHQIPPGVTSYDRRPG